MRTILLNAGAVCVLCSIVLPFLLKKSSTIDPQDSEKEFDEKVIYGDFKEFIWKKKQKVK